MSYWQLSLLTLAFVLEGCSSASSSSEKSAGDAPRWKDLRMFCGWPARFGRGGRELAIGGRQLPVPQEPGVIYGYDDASRSCRALALLHGESSTRVFLTDLDYAKDHRRLISCLAKEGGSSASSLVSEGSSGIELTYQIARHPTCWNEFMKSKRLAAAYPRFEPAPVLTSQSIAMDFESNRRGSVLSKIGIYDDVARAIPIEVGTDRSDTVYVNCLVFRGPDFEGPEEQAPVDAVEECLSRLSA